MRPRLLGAAGDPARTGADLAEDLADDLAEDLRLHHLWTAMARGDERLYALARAATLAPLTDPAAIEHRQRVLSDCLRNPGTVRALHRLAAEAVDAEQKIFRGGRPEALLNRSVRTLELACESLRDLRDLAAERAPAFRSAGFAELFGSLRAEVDEDYLRTAEALLGDLRFDHGIIAAARLGPGNKSTDLRLYAPPGKGRAPRRFRRTGLTHTVPSEHEENWRALPAFRDLVLADVARATAESADHVRGFLRALRDELGFYVGCLNLAETLTGLGLPVCLPEPRPAGDRTLAARELYDPGLALRQGRATACDVAAAGTGLIVITGANRGGKSTFLRGAGTAQLMMQCGMFVPAREFAASVADGVFTHFKRAEDRSMTSGKLDEELARMSAVVDRIRPGSLVLCNESFSSTSEREGAEIAAEILRALGDLGTRTIFVTHLYDLARRLHDDPPAGTLFLRTEHDDTGAPTYRLVPGAPSPTARAMAIYARVFGAPPPP
ncbi:hypothetical protein [Spirillospora sp. NPDC029432]|uniref:MutS-related protein n=1 Tax=Spirillospora sp. NPDC029432 TaxID=3154599 RepID=UPI00345209C4